MPGRGHFRQTSASALRPISEGRRSALGEAGKAKRESVAAKTEATARADARPEEVNLSEQPSNPCEQEEHPCGGVSQLNDLTAAETVASLEA